MVALNIQRGRDHAIQGYIHYFDICRGHKKPSAFNDLRQSLSQQNFEHIRRIYKHVEDIGQVRHQLLQAMNWPQVALSSIFGCFDCLMMIFDLLCPLMIY